MIGLVDFSSPEIERTLDLYTSIEPIRMHQQRHAGVVGSKASLHCVLITLVLRD